MYRTGRYEDVEECARLWKQWMPQKCLFDLWPVRKCFADEFGHRPCFLTAEEAEGQILGLLPLSWIEEEGLFGLFPGEIWQGKTWLEQNRIMARDQSVAEHLVSHVPGKSYLRYLLGGRFLPKGTVVEPDETGYLFFPAECGYTFERYMQRFSGKTRKKIRHELAGLESAGVSYRHGELSDLDTLFRMSLEVFGDQSYFHDPRFLKSFENLAQWLHVNGLLRVTTVIIGGRTAAVDMGAIWNKTYTVLAGGVDAEFPGVAKLINFHHIRWACESRMNCVDFMCGEFGWKDRFHLTPRILYKIRVPEPHCVGLFEPRTPTVSSGVVTAPSSRTLVVGTTPDYVDWIRRECPGRALFITDSKARWQADEPRPPEREEILCDLSNAKQVSSFLSSHLRRENMVLEGITCFDCESMELAAVLASLHQLPYPSGEAVANCRDKYRSKTLWRRQGLHAPRCVTVHSEDDAVAFFRGIGGPCVLKPASGSGSELIFSCATETECREHFRDIRDGLNVRKSSRMYADLAGHVPAILAEERILGQEFSCDFIIDGDRLEILRLTRKIMDNTGPFGTARAYVLSTALPPHVDQTRFEKAVFLSARSVGITRAVCMLDFMVCDRDLVLLEIAPRPGGDCIPFLLKTAWNLDILKVCLDFACNRRQSTVHAPTPEAFLGLRFHAREQGTLRSIDVERLVQDPRVVNVHLIRRPGDAIRMPPEDYDKWVLGHAIVRPFAGKAIVDQCRDLSNRLVVEIQGQA